jgi:hypothetical protein
MNILTISIIECIVGSILLVFSGQIVKKIDNWEDAWHKRREEKKLNYHQQVDE